MKKRIFILTLVTLLASSPAWAGWYFSLGYRSYPLYYARYGGFTFVSYPSVPVSRAYPLFPISGYRPYGGSSLVGPVEEIRAMGEEKRMQWKADKEKQTSSKIEPVETVSQPPVVEEAPVTVPAIESGKKSE
ncbi:MAG: hypothetical protein HYU99_10455 [Deltaproteobacteria bacterium]|nr:hypothetical protein [Deltaproteobacteria bacterium]